MKKLLVILMFLCSTSVFAQDVIVKKDGSHIECKVVEVNDSGVVYKKWSNLNGNNYEIDRADVSSINYQSGKKEDYSEVNNLYKPGNQNEGTQQVNDIELIRMDYLAHNTLKKAKKTKIIGWIGGTLLVLSGGALSSLYEKQSYGHPESNLGALIGGVTCIAAGVGLTTCCLIKAHKINKQVNLLQSNSLWQKEFKMNSNSSFMAGVDVLKDNMNNTQTLGLGFRYNF